MRNTPLRDDHASGEHAQSLPATNLKRRRFLLALGAGTAGTAAAAAQAMAPLPPGLDAATPEQGRGYQETDHVRDYYASTRV